MQLDTTSGKLVVHSPAKVNLMLSVHGKRSDGFHELTSLVVALKFGDRLAMRIAASAKDSLHCSNAAVPTGLDNLVLKAAASLRARLGAAVYFEFDLDKQIPMGAGLGGGSGNAVAALLGMNQLLKTPLSEGELYALAADIGSDCPFFIAGVTAWICGRGERVEPLALPLAKQLSGTRLVLFKPDFEVETACAYRRLAGAGSENHYSPGSVDKGRLEALIQAGALSSLLYNSFENPVGEKYLALPTLLEQLRESGVACLMSGSGSACFALPDHGSMDIVQIRDWVRNTWGKTVFWVETSIC